MSRMDKRDIEHSLYVKQQRRDRIDQSISKDSYENSILYHSDILNNDPVFKNVLESIENMGNDTNQVYISSKNVNTTAIWSVSGDLKSLNSTLDSMLIEANNIRTIVYNASKQVYEEKLTLYNDNIEKIKSIEESIRDCLNQYEENSVLYDKTKNKLNQMLSEDPERSKFETLKKQYYEKMDRLLNSAEGHLELMEDQNEENELLLQTYLKRVS